MRDPTNSRSTRPAILASEMLAHSSISFREPSTDLSCCSRTDGVTPGWRYNASFVARCGIRFTIAIFSERTPRSRKEPCRCYYGMSSAWPSNDNTSSLSRLSSILRRCVTRRATSNSFPLISDSSHWMNPFKIPLCLAWRLPPSCFQL